MEFMGFHIVDIIIATLILFLAIKGLINGFSKELLSFITIVGGIALAANFNTTVVDLINEQHIVPTIAQSYAKIVGFIVIIVAVWIIISVISSIIDRFGSDTISPISRIFGYIVSATRYFVIFALIVFGMNQSEFFKNETKKLKTETKLFVPMTKIGATILNIDLNRTVEENNSSNIVLNSHDNKKEDKTSIIDTNSTDKNSTEEVLNSVDENISAKNDNNTTN